MPRSTQRPVVVRLDGDLGIAGTMVLRQRLMRVLRPEIRLMIVDLSFVETCDPAGLAVLIGIQRRARERGIVLRLVAPSPAVAKVLRSTGLERCLTVCQDLPRALTWGSDEPARGSATTQLLAG
jgi:anti-anti-sigma factor